MCANSILSQIWKFSQNVQICAGMNKAKMGITFDLMHGFELNLEDMLNIQLLLV